MSPRAAAAAALLGLGLVASAAGHGRLAPHWRPPPRGWEVLQRSERTHGPAPRWTIRDWKLKLTRRWLDEHGREDRREEETQTLLKGRRPRILLETPTDAGWRVVGFDGRRAWITVNGYRYRGEAALVEAEERVREQAFVSRLPFILREKDSRSWVRGPSVHQGKPTVVVEVRYTGGTRPADETLHAHLDAGTYRLVKLVYDRPAATPGSHYELHLDEYSTVQGVFVPFRRRYYRNDGALFKEERVHGISVNQRPPEWWFRNPIRLPEWRGIPAVGAAATTGGAGAGL